MRKILYPLFLLAIVGTLGFFFWESFSPLWQKVIIVIGIILTFFVFKNILFTLFGFIFNRLSSLLKWIVSALLFALLAWGIWSFLPNETQNKILAVKSSLQEKTNIIDKGIASIDNAATTAKDGVIETIDDGKLAVNNQEQDSKDFIKDKELAMQESIKNGIEIQNNQEKNTDISKGDTEKTLEEKGLKIPSVIIENEIYVNNNSGTVPSKKPVVQYTTENNIENQDNNKDLDPSSSAISSTNVTTSTENTVDKNNQDAERNAELQRRSDELAAQIENEKRLQQEALAAQEKSRLLNVEAMKKNNIHLINSGQENVKVEGITSGTEYEKFLALTQGGSVDENIFFSSERENNMITYTTFAHKTLWKVTVTLDKKATEKDFISIIKKVKL